MDGVFQFSDYDLFAHVATGMIAIVLFDLVFSTHHVLGAAWSVADGVVLVLVAYVVGHILSSLASWSLERNLVRRWLGRPMDILLGRPSGGASERFSRRLVPSYYRPLPPAVQARLKSLAEGMADVEDLFWRAHAASKREPAAAARMESFIRLYGFARNIAFVTFVGAVGLLGSAVWEYLAGNAADGSRRLAWSALCLVAGVGMLERYLKFYRHYGQEVLVTLAFQKDAEE